MGNLTTGIVAAALWIALTVCASAQGFMVKPMKLELTPRPGQKFEVPLEIRNTSGEETRVVVLRLVGLSQTSMGSWMAVEPDQPREEDAPAIPSAVDWISLGSELVNIEPMEAAEIPIQIDVPAAARGAYFAAIIAEAPAPEATQGLSIRVRFLIPIIIEIQGRPVRQRVQLEDAVLAYQVEDGQKPLTTAYLKIVNRGETLSRVRGSLLVEQQIQNRWRPVTRFETEERSILPGMTFELGKDLERNLPSGVYRLRAEAFVDGRRIAPLEKEIQFEGDPGATSVAYDAMLEFEPDHVVLEATAGANRTAVLQVTNPSEDPVQVRMAIATPRELAGVEIGGFRGTMLSAEPWLRVQPSEFVLRPGGRQNIRVIAQPPREGYVYPNYYAELISDVTYPDGQSAGGSSSLVQLVNPTGRTVTRMNLHSLNLAQAEDSIYAVQVKLTNAGNVQIEPTVRVSLLSARGAAVRTLTLSGREGVILPLSTRVYSGEMDFSNVEEGHYTLEVSAGLGEDVSNVERLRLQVRTEEEQGVSGGNVMIRRVAIVDEPVGDGSTQDVMSEAE